MFIDCDAPVRAVTSMEGLNPIRSKELTEFFLNITSKNQLKRGHGSHMREREIKDGMRNTDLRCELASYEFLARSEQIEKRQPFWSQPQSRVVII